MNSMSFLKGLGLGVAAGMTVAVMMLPPKKGSKSLAGKALRAIGDVVEKIH